MDLKEIVYESVNKDTSRSGYGPVADSCEHGDEPSGSIKGGEYDLSELSTSQEGLCSMESVDKVSSNNMRNFKKFQNTNHFWMSLNAVERLSQETGLLHDLWSEQHLGALIPSSGIRRREGWGQSVCQISLQPGGRGPKIRHFRRSGSYVTRPTPITKLYM
jgi:hypothetical protein